jgi:hypothetical protein
VSPSNTCQFFLFFFFLNYKASAPNGPGFPKWSLHFFLNYNFVQAEVTCTGLPFSVCIELLAMKNGPRKQSSGSSPSAYF